MEAEWIILADHVEVVNGKTYLMGGGWENLTVNTLFPVTHQCGVAVAFSVPWNETNQQHDIEVEVADPDGETLAKIEGQMEVGRPPGTPLGKAQRMPLAINFGLQIKKFGPHAIIARVEGQELKRIGFNVVAGPALAAQQMVQRADEMPS